VIREASFHRRRNAQCLMHPAEIVIGAVDGNHVAVILKLLREGIGQAREAPDAHSQVQILPFYVTGQDMIAVRVAAQDACTNTDALGGAGQLKRLCEGNR
jgi:hypothetical protein